MRCVLVLLLTCAYAVAPAQSAQGGFGIELNFFEGKVLKHTKTFKAPIPDQSNGAELNFVWQTDGRKAWQQRRHYPLWGIGIAYTNYGMDEVYGRCISVYPNLQVSLVRINNFEWTLKMGAGVGYVTKRFSRAPDWDTINNAIGSHLNAYACFATDLRWHINRHWDVQAGVGFSHISNGAFRQPNLGVNLYSAQVGFRYFPVNSRPHQIVSSLAALPNRWLAHFRLGIAFNESGYADGPLYPDYLLTAWASKRYKSRNRIFIGTDYAYDSHIYAFLRNNEILQGDEKAHSWKGTVFVGHEWLIGAVGLQLQAGVYYRQAYLKLMPVYEKIGLCYYITRREQGILKELTAGIYLKTHLAQAELGEFGIGFGF